MGKGIKLTYQSPKSQNNYLKLSRKRYYIPIHVQSSKNVMKLYYFNKDENIHKIEVLKGRTKKQ